MGDVWRLLDSGTVPPAVSAALDEAVLEAHSRGSVPDTLHFYVRSSPTVSVGYFQGVGESVDLEACGRHGVHVVRRGSGGSTIYTDPGQLIYGLVVRSDELPPTPDASFALVCGAVARAVSSFGVEARHRPVNDVEVGGRKVSGSAQLRRRGSVLQHGTIILDTDLAAMDAVLRGGGRRPSERVATLASLLGRAPDMEEMKRRVRNEVGRAFGAAIEEGCLTDAERADVERLVAERYSRDEWNLRL
ncbi:MAG: biotin/lipoate A/B protein ligase family protein [Candidatus Thermoplasmatota archaeon]